MRKINFERLHKELIEAEGLRSISHCDEYWKWIVMNTDL